MRVYVTGINGFVGKNLTRYLKKNFEIFGISRKILSDRSFNKISSCEVLIHLAGKAHDFKKTTNPEEYYKVNTELTKRIFDVFLESDSRVFITLSSIKAVADIVDGVLTEQNAPDPKTPYGISKFLAEQYIFTKKIPPWKEVYILRPCMIHGAFNKGNLNLLFKLVAKGIPWPLGAFENKRSFCSIDNLCFVIKELIEREDIPSGIYNVADDEPVSTNELIQWMAEAQGKKPVLLQIPKELIISLSKLGDKLRLPINSERLQKLTETYLVSNKKLKQALAKPLPLTAKEGFMKTFQSFNQAK